MPIAIIKDKVDDPPDEIDGYLFSALSGGAAPRLYLCHDACGGVACLLADGLCVAERTAGGRRRKIYDGGFRHHHVDLPHWPELCLGRLAWPGADRCLACDDQRLGGSYRRLSLAVPWGKVAAAPRCLKTWKMVKASL